VPRIDGLYQTLASLADARLAIFSRHENLSTNHIARIHRRMLSQFNFECGGIVTLTTLICAASVG
jgi:hypothetical protein